MHEGMQSLKLTPATGTTDGNKADGQIPSKNERMTERKEEREGRRGGQSKKNKDG